jgi:hypothetical protein
VLISFIIKLLLSIANKTLKRIVDLAKATVTIDNFSFNSVMYAFCRKASTLAEILVPSNIALRLLFFGRELLAAKVTKKKLLQCKNLLHLFLCLVKVAAGRSINYMLL